MQIWLNILMKILRITNYIKVISDKLIYFFPKQYVIFEINRKFVCAS